jgi:ribosomal protein S18 acetylase RimI-like enzyme
MITIRQCVLEDLDNILKIQYKCYPSYLHEDGSVFVSIILQSKLCYVLTKNNIIIGYILAHLWDNIDNPPTLHDTIPYAKGKYCFIHDMCIDPDMQHKGYGNKLLKHLYLNTNYTEKYIIIAVNNAHVFWEKQGYVYKTITKEKIETYGEGAYYMECDLRKKLDK